MHRKTSLPVGWNLDTCARFIGSAIDGTFVLTRTATSECRVVPDGCMDLIWDGKGLIVAGPDTRAQLSSVPMGTDAHRAAVRARRRAGVPGPARRMSCAASGRPAASGPRHQGTRRRRSVRGLADCRQRRSTAPLPLRPAVTTTEARWSSVDPGRTSQTRPLATVCNIRRIMLPVSRTSDHWAPPQPSTGRAS